MLSPQVKYLNNRQFLDTTRTRPITLSILFLGIYSLDVYSTAFHFPQLKLKVSSENATVSVVEYKYPGAARQPAPYPIIVSALAPIQYEVPKPPFSLLSMLMGNPMILMMIFMGGMAFIMPKVRTGCYKTMRLLIHMLCMDWFIARFVSIFYHSILCIKLFV